MVLGQLFEMAVTDTINACVTGIEDVRGSRFENQRAEGADVAAVDVIPIRAIARLCIQPGIGREQYALDRCFH